MNPNKRIEHLTPPAILETHDPAKALHIENGYSSSSLSGTKNSLTKGESFELPKSILKKIPLESLKNTSATIDGILLRDGEFYIQIKIQSGSETFVREFPATDPMFDLGEIVPLLDIEKESIPTTQKMDFKTDSALQPIELKPELSYIENRKQLTETYDALTQEEIRIYAELKKLRGELPAETGFVKSPEQIESEKQLGKEAFAIISKKGIDRIVIHGGQKKMPDGTLVETIESDLDVESALFLLYTKKNGKDSDTIAKFNPTAFIEPTAKGAGGIGLTIPGQVIFHIDRSGKDFGIEVIDGVTHIYADHHGQFFGSDTSATQIVDEVLSESPEYIVFKKANPWVQEYIDTVTNIDNLTYTKETIPGGTKHLFDRYAFTEKWPGSIYALSNSLGTKEIQRLFKLKCDPWKPFADEDLSERLKEIIAKNKEQAEKAISGVERALIEQEKELGLPRQTAELGKYVYHNYGIAKPNGKPGKNINVIPNNLGFTAAEAAGCDTYVTRNPKTGGFKINSSKNITPVFERIEKLYPGSILVRGVIIIGPMENPELLKSVSEEQFLQAAGLK